MELVWNNPSPNRKVYRPSVWEVMHKEGSSRVIPVHEIQAITSRILERGVKEADAVVATSLVFLCF
jgi:hypothetical protein